MQVEFYLRTIFSNCHRSLSRDWRGTFSWYAQVKVPKKKATPYRAISSLLKVCWAAIGNWLRPLCLTSLRELAYAATVCFANLVVANKNLAQTAACRLLPSTLRCSGALAGDSSQHHVKFHHQQFNFPQSFRRRACPRMFESGIGI